MAFGNNPITGRPGPTIIKADGTRGCKECRRAFDRNRGRDAAYWRAYREQRGADRGC